ncbi:MULTISPECIES: hypothetical protein [Proteus]|uniref:hypothetical protein n=1 Tax=Proteus TaxID=583 RepID=UPI0018A65135|nr:MULTISPECIES: hypothetical protein [Proteus]MCI9776512.1 hypothetical protein [Proteus mirabilis]MDF7401147.1 hypothetical protein [Proteus mirabilis]QOR44353.1 hypothetical protein GV833_17945 [Proteus mirabilis]WPD00361.1 hypothetical protein R5P25_07575 [Proteus terrae]
MQGTNLNVGDKVAYLRFGKIEPEYIGTVIGEGIRKTIAINCSGEKYLAPPSKLISLPLPPMPEGE